ncbi:hypothetical protein D9611_007536 [Ephemerocybe angulata]|uniref:F-box domain-containing protein n=1 Tax=Ephemerocybe angulata TaxID=980116 RepID=A0A8H5BYV8_9AGAR|nr:hypothetical protein D9611_007536 [Tulosesus angulatus]
MASPIGETVTLNVELEVACSSPTRGSQLVLRAICCFLPSTSDQDHLAMQRQASATARGLIIADFSPEILAIIFALALVDTPGDPATLGRIATVCTQWKNVLYSHPRFWTSLRLSLRASRK